MLDDDKNHGILLLAIEHLNVQYQVLPTPCIALLIARYYRLLATIAIEQNKQESYAINAKSWLTAYIKHPNHTAKMQHQLNDLIYLNLI